MKIQVTQADIDNGIPEDDCRCPIALALKRAGYPAYVGDFKVEMEDGTEVLLPDSARHFIERFDRDFTSVSPFEFDLAI